jgi:hypothetical protein
MKQQHIRLSFLSDPKTVKCPEALNFFMRLAPV